MKSAKEWEDIYMCSEVPTTIEQLIEVAQKDAYNQAIEDVSIKAEIHTVDSGILGVYYEVDKQSILNLKK